MSRALVAGVGMSRFVKPGRQQPYRVMTAEAILAAVKDAGIDHRLVQQAYASFIYGDTGSGQHGLYEAFQTGIPVFNVNNACCSGSTALFLARQAVESGQVDCALAFGFEEVQPGALDGIWPDREFVGDRTTAQHWFGGRGGDHPVRQVKLQTERIKVNYESTSC